MQYLTKTNIIMDKVGELASLLSAAEDGNTKDFEKSLACFDSLDQVFDYRNEEGYTLLHVGSKHGHPEIVKLLLDSGFPMEAEKDLVIGNNNDPLDGVTALIVAVSEDRVEVVKFLLERGADIHASHNRYGLSPLCFAAMGENKQMIQILIDSGALSPLQRNLVDDGNANLLYTQFARSTEIFKYIFDRETDKGRIFNYPLRAAIERSDLDLVKYVLNREKPKGDEKCLTIAFCDAARSDNTEILELLMNLGAHVNCISPTKHWTPLMYSASSGHKNIFQYLLDHGAQINATAEDGANALFIAAERHYIEVMELAIKNGGDINVIVNDETMLSKTLPLSGTIERQAAEILVKEILLLQFFGFPVNQEDLLLIKNNDILRRFEENLKADLEKMKGHKLPETIISLFDLITARNVTQLSAYANNNDVCEALKSAEIDEKFPKFASNVRKSFAKGVERKYLLKRVCCFFATLAGRKEDRLPKLPTICVHEIFAGLTNQDLINLREAYF